MRLTFARLPVGDVAARVSVESLPAVLAEAALRVVTALPAHAAARVPREFVQLHVESAVLRVQVAVTR